MDSFLSWSILAAELLVKAAARPVARPEKWASAAGAKWRLAVHETRSGKTGAVEHE
jgi:hypothetical protein